MGNNIPKFLFIISFIIFSLVPAVVSKADNKQAQSYRDKGYEAQRLGNLDMALSFYQRTIEVDPSYTTVYNDMGIIFEAKGMNDKAKDAYLKAISLDPNYLGAYYNLAALYEKEGDFENAKYYWRKRVNLGDWSDDWTWRANEHLANLEGSKRDIPPSGTDPKHAAQFHLHRGRQFLVKNDFVNALKEFEQAIILDPNNRDLKQLLEDTNQKVLLYN